MPLNYSGQGTPMPGARANPAPGTSTPAAGARRSPMAARFPGLTDQQIMEMRDKDPGSFAALLQGRQGPGVGRQAPGRTAMPRPSAPPAMAPAINAQMPGFFNPQQPANGVSPQGFGAARPANAPPAGAPTMPATSLLSSVSGGARPPGVAAPAYQMPAGVSPGRTPMPTVPSTYTGTFTAPQLAPPPTGTGSLGGAATPAFDRDPRRVVPPTTPPPIGGVTTGTPIPWAAPGGAAVPQGATAAPATPTTTAGMQQVRGPSYEGGPSLHRDAQGQEWIVYPDGKIEPNGRVYAASGPTAAAGQTPGKTAAAGEEGSAEAEAGDAAPGAAPEDSGKPWQGDTRTFEEMFGGPKPAGWANWSQNKRAAWKAENYQPAAGTGGTGTGGDAGAGGTGGDTGTGGTGGQTGGDQTGGGQQGGGAAAATYTAGDPATYWNADGTPTWTAADIRAMESEDRNFLQPKPEGFAGWDRARKDQWLAANFNPYGTTQGYIQNAPFEAAMAQFAKVYGADIPGVSARQLEGAVPRETPVNIPAGSSPPLWSQLLGNDPVTMGLVDKAQNAFDNLTQITINPSAYGNNALSEALDTYYATTTALGRLGVNYDPWATYQDPGYAGGNTPGGGADDTDIATQLPDFDKFVSDLKQSFRGESPERIAALTEAAMGRWLTENAMQNQQRGVNITEEELNRLMNDQLRIQAEQGALGLFEDPSGVDFGGIRNRYVSDANSRFASEMDALNASAARRGLTPGTIAGITGNLSAQQSNAIARGLGELTTQEQMADREGLYRAIENAANTNRAFSGAESIARQNLANMVAGAPSVTQNPYSGMANSAANVAAIDLQRRLAEEEDDGGYGQLIGSILGAGVGLIPGAGWAGAAFGSQLGGQIGGAF